MSLSNLHIKGKRVLVRVDFNVPLDENFKVQDDTRIRKALPTLKYLLEGGASVVLMSHLGRPKGVIQELSLCHIVPKLEELLGLSVKFAKDCVGDTALDITQSLKPGEVALLENLRFHNEEKEGDEFFAGQLAESGDIYVNDAFGTAHRAHASTSIIARFFPVDKAFGLLLQGEIDALSKVMSDPASPLLAIIGGAKVSSKLAILESLVNKVDRLMIGGGMAYTFVLARGGNVGNSLVEENMVPRARDILKKAEEKGVEVFLPVDSVIADKFSDDAKTQSCSTDDIPDGWMGLDIGPDSANKFAEVVRKSKTILWNGPMGVFEIEKFSNGTFTVANALKEATDIGGYTLIGGGDSVAAINAANLSDQVSYVSTGGGAMLEYLEGKVLPAIAAMAE
ncbi:MAG: phosphoglycerate kinase [Crocinitomicaceae bacterium]|nr:phosphoglycerate kinase [Crocinitomicaceae bacterium]|tara:strand:- start:32677 stop:33861 length:1185 start_codon:yes stop_codon:yes gene_type:complete